MTLLNCFHSKQEGPGNMSVVAQNHESHRVYGSLNSHVARLYKMGFAPTVTSVRSVAPRAR